MFDGYNHTELYQLCRAAGLGVTPSAPRELLARYLAGTSEAPPARDDLNDFDGWRLAIIGFINDHWEKLAPQLKCPARELRGTLPRACFGCLDHQVVACITENKKHHERLKRYLPVKR